MPYTNEHSARLMNKDAEHIKVSRTKGGNVQGVQVPESISVIWFIQKKNGKEIPVPQSLRFPLKRWTSGAAKTWLDMHKIKCILFEPANPKKNAEDSIPCYSAYVNETKKQLNIILHDEIGFYGVQSKKFYELLADNSDVKTIAIDINSPGGSVFDGFSIYNALKAHEAEIQVKISGIAASIASVIAMAASPGKLEMPENATIMIHKPFVRAVIGADADKLRTQAEALDKIEKGIIAAYKSRLGLSDSEIAGLLKKTTYYTAAEAKEAGLADVITEEAAAIDNYFDMESYVDQYGEIPEAVLNLVDIERDDDLDFNIEDPQDPPKNNLDKLIDLITQLLNLKKERKPMSDKELEDRIAALEKSDKDQKAANEALTAERDQLKTENETLKTTVQNQTEAAEKKNLETRKAEYKTFCEKLVGEGKIIPANVETHVDTLEMKFQADVAEQKDGSQETPRVDAYKKMLNELPVSIPVGERHLADKDKRGDDETTSANEDPLDKAARKIVNDAKGKGIKISYVEAVNQAYSENPSLYNKDNQFVEQG